LPRGGEAASIGLPRGGEAALRGCGNWKTLEIV